METIGIIYCIAFKYRAALLGSTLFTREVTRMADAAVATKSSISCSAFSSPRQLPTGLGLVQFVVHLAVQSSIGNFLHRVVIASAVPGPPPGLISAFLAAIFRCFRGQDDRKPEASMPRWSRQSRTENRRPAR